MKAHIENHAKEVVSVMWVYVPFSYYFPTLVTLIFRFKMKVLD